ncbi:hypothetical protein [Geodermatophilus sabuli]|uniref:Meckel syndrome type 1 protein n=1 Tax=Geodermatophilus sabuli TaxID=1564158 RepID=A0A285EGQ4_9ACTN|nr:hypothetical protein [Geodermatophilus sabuli]MBB3083171.1 hypothetical protein [Geodermatophilus sabuli]SNX98167.1 hypothetical protein SAMN06893097_109247 [Geodermatophilus sabuli]
MPLPSVEAASREAAIAAAREKYGASVRIVGIRRVRTGGVMGFFTTERYVVEVEEIAPAPVERRPASRAESAARIEAALRRAPVLPDPVDEVAGLLAGDDEPAVGLYSRSAARSGHPAADRRAPRAGSRPAATPPRAAAPEPVRAAAAPRAAAPSRAGGSSRRAAPAAAAAPVDAAPALSPFTAALAQMVAGDVDVREAVDEAIAAVAAAAPAPGAPVWEPVAEDLPAWEPAAEDAPAWEPAVEAAPVRQPAVEVPVAPAPVPVAPVPAEAPSSATLWGPAPTATPTPTPAPAPAATPAPAEVAAEVASAPPVAAQVPVPPVAAQVPPVAEPASPVAADMAPVPVVAAPAVPQPTRVPDWVHEPDFTTGPATSREEAIAEVLRAALAHDTSDAALTQLLRGVLAGSAAQEEATAQDPGAYAYADGHLDDYAFAEAHTAEIPIYVDAEAEADEWEVVAEVLAPTASDPAPLPLDATTVLPPLSLLPPPAPGTALAVPPLLSRPPVPPAIRPPSAGQVARTSGPRSAPGLATVHRLPVDKRAASWRRSAPMIVTSVREQPQGGAPVPPGPGAAEQAVVRRLLELGVPERLLGPDFASEVAQRGTYAALTRSLAAGLPTPPALPTGPGEVLLVVGPGVETLAAARSLAAWLRLDAERLQWASRGDLAALAPQGNRITSIDAALERKQETDRSGTLTIVAVDAPLRAAASTWLEQVIAVFAPAGVWAVVEATRKPEDVGPWLDGLPRVDALMVQDTDLTADPAAVLSRTATPVALLDGARATAHRWASLLCERLETSGR